MDMTLTATAVVLTIFASVMLVVYLWLERGSIFDPIAVSWAGYILFIPLAMIGVAVLYPERSTASYGLMGCALTVLATASYTVGLYIGRAIRFSRLLPAPRPAVSKGQIWLALILSAAVLPTFPLLWPSLVEVAGNSAGTILYDSLFSVTLISIIGLVMLRGSPISRILMAVIAATASVAIMWTIWSRRPLVGVLIAGVGLFYHFRIANRSALTKMWYFAGLMAAMIVLVFYLESTRGERFYGRLSKPSAGIFSTENIDRMLGGVEMNYRVYEYALQEFPAHHPYLYGSGYVPGICWFPRALWPSKPLGTGYVISQMWFDREELQTNLGLPTMGEAYANFGIIGIAVILFLIGRIVRVLNTYLQIHYHNVIAWAAWLMIIPDVATEWRGDFTSMTSQAILRVLGFLIVMWVSGWIVPAARSINPRRILPPGPGRPLAWKGMQPLAVQQQRPMIKRT